MNRIHAKRLLHLADHLDTVRPENFNINLYCYEGECGTVACAVGHACLMPRFRQLGLSGGIPTYQGIKTTGAYIGPEFFGLTGDETNELFYLSGYNNTHTPKQVARKIRRVVRGHHPQLVKGWAA